MPHAHLKWKCLQEAADAAHFPNVITLGRYTCRQQQYHCCCCCCCCRAFSIWISLPASLPSPRAPSPSLDWQNNNNNWGQPASREHSSDLHARQNLYIFTDYIHTHTHIYIEYIHLLYLYIEYTWLLHFLGPLAALWVCLPLAKLLRQPLGWALI